LLDSPKYIQFSDREKNEFLSQIGNFSIEERQIFALMCSQWEAHIPYEELYRKLTQQSINYTTAFETLIKKLEMATVAVLHMEIIEKKYLPQYIVLAEENSSLFWYEYLSNWILQALLSPEKALPLLSEVSASHKKFSKEILQSTSFDNLIKIENSNQEDAFNVYALSLDQSESMLVPVQKSSKMITSILLKLKYFLRSTNVISNISKLLNRSVASIQEASSQNSFYAWKEITKVIHEHSDQLAPNKQRKESKELYYYAIYLYQYILAQEKKTQSEHEEKEKIETDFGAILEAIQKAGTNPLSKEDFNNILKHYEQSYKDQFSAFYHQFLETHVASISAGHLPSVLMLANGFIHKDNLFLYFYNNYLHTNHDLNQHYISLLNENLHNTYLDSIFLDTPTFETTVKNEVKTRNPFLYTIIEKPALLAEIIMHHVQISGKRNKLKEAERLLNIFFLSDTMAIKSYQNIFELDLKNIYIQAVRKLGLFKKFWMKLTGRYANLLTKFSRQYNEDDIIKEVEGSEKETIQKKYFLQQSQAQNKGDKNQKKQSPTEKNEETLSSSSSPLNSKTSYSQEQINDMWNALKKTIRK